MPQQLIYNYGNDKVYAVNDEKEETELTATMKVYDLDGKVLIDARCEVEMPEGCSKPVFDVMSIAGGESPVKFVFLTLEDAAGNVVSRNEYCLAEVMDEHNWSKYRWWRTQIESYADFSALNEIAEADVAVSVTKDADGEYIVPAYWTDNLVSIEPGQTLTFKCSADDIPDGAAVEVEGWNVEGIRIGL